MTWEYFRDRSYFDMWCVRPKGERRFGYGFHLVNADEAKGLAELLTASGTSGSAQDAQRLDPKGAGPTREAGDAQ